MKKNKTASRDFTEEQLPHDRPSLFADCLKMQFGTLVKVGLVLLLFALPLVGISLLTEVQSASILNAVESGTVSMEEATASLHAAQIFGKVLCIPAWIVFAIGLAGVMRIIRQLCFEESVFFRYDFIQGVRSGALTHVLLFALWGLLDLGTAIISGTMTNLFLSYIPLSILWLVALPVGLWSVSQMNLYRNRFGKYLSNGFSFFMRCLPVSLLGTLAVSLPALAHRFLPAVLLLAGLDVLYLVFLLPLFLLGWSVYAHGIFDRYINREHYPEIYRKGLYPGR